MKNPDTLCSALGITRPQLVAIAGSGGKTTLLHALAGELSRQNQKVAATTTTHFYPPAAGLFSDLWLLGDRLPDSAELALRLHRGNPLALASERTANGKLRGLSPEQIEPIARNKDVFVLVEADGAARRPLKAWAEWEPVIPDDTELLIVMVGASGLGRTLGPEWVHRPELFSQASGLAPGKRITPQAVAEVILGPEGPLRNKPAKSRAILVLNQADAASSDQIQAFKAALKEKFEEYKPAPPPFSKILAGKLRQQRLEEL